MYERHRRSLLTVLALGAGAMLMITPMASAAGMGSADANQVVVAGGQFVTVDGDRPGRFHDFREVPNGVLLEYLRWGVTSGDGSFQVHAVARDLGQRDESFTVRAGFGARLQLRLDGGRLPRTFGNDALSVLDRVGPGEFRIADFIQKRLEDPDGNGIPYYLPGQTGDNAGARALMNELVASRGTLTPGLDREGGRLSGSFTPRNRLRLTFAVARENRDGLRPYGTGTYQRTNDEPNNNYWFHVRGVELLRPIDERTTTVDVAGAYQHDRWFARLGANFSRYENDIPALTYDNPFWFSDTIATTGSRRGLWQEGRTAMAPANDAWTASLTAGVALPRGTRVTVGGSFGEHRQDEPFLPLATNRALIGYKDLNGDGVVDALDDPTIAGTLPQRSLDGRAEVATANVTATSRPWERVALTARYRLYDYTAKHKAILFPWRSYYVESSLIDRFQGAVQRAWPMEYQRQTYGLEAVVRPDERVAVGLLAERRDFDRDRYFDGDGDTHKDGGSRAVSGTEETILGGSLTLTPNDRVDVRLGYRRAAQDFSGTYNPGFRGELQTLRQYDIAKRDRDHFDGHLNLTPMDKVTIGVSGRVVRDDYSESLYGMQEAQETGGTVSVNVQASPRLALYAHADVDRGENDLRAATKCNTCPAREPAGTPDRDFTTTGFTWNTSTEDVTTAITAGADYVLVPNKYRVQVSGSYLQGKVTQTTRNEGTPAGLVGAGHDFPEQTSRLLSSEVKVTRRLNERYSMGMSYLFEDFDLDDWQWTPVQPYGAEFLEIDDATRYLFLDSRYGDYRAHVARVFMKVRF